MKKLLALVLVLGIASLSMAATISIVGPAAGAPGSKDNPLKPSDMITLAIVSDASVLTVDAVVTVDGLGSMVKAFSLADAYTRYGWDRDLSMGASGANDVEFTPKTLGFGAGNFGGLGGPGKVIGEIIIHCDGESLEPVIVGIRGVDTYVGGSLNIDGVSFAQFGLPVEIWQVPEPMTMSLLGMGALALIRRRRA